MECLERSLKRFLFFVDVIEKKMGGDEYKEEKDKLKEVLEVAKQMCELLPLKIQKSKQGYDFVGSA